MEYDLTLKNFLKNDENLNRIELKLSLVYVKCKLEKCYSSGNNLKTFTHEYYEECKEKCMKNLTKLNLLKKFVYQDFNNFYYSKFLECGKMEEEDKYIQCKESNKNLMKKNIDDIKNLLLNYKFNN